MINEEKVKEMYRVARYDSSKTRKEAQYEHYYRKDYIRKELMKSVFSGTIVFMLVLLLWGMNQANSLLDQLNSMDFVEIGVVFALVYIAFLVLYLWVTYLVFQIRFRNGRKALKQYYLHLKNLEKMYEREEK